MGRVAGLALQRGVRTRKVFRNRWSGGVCEGGGGEEKEGSSG